MVEGDVGRLDVRLLQTSETALPDRFVLIPDPRVAVDRVLRGLPLQLLLFEQKNHLVRGDLERVNVTCGRRGLDPGEFGAALGST